jgi:signal transduction histidine kinase
LFLAIFVIFLSLPANGDEASDGPVNVMLLYTGELFLPAAIVQDTALRQAFINGTRRSISFHLETLQAGSLTNREFEVELADFIRRKYQDQQIDLIVAGGSLALNFLERNRATLWPGTPAIFFSVDESLGLHRKFSPGTTGLTIKFDPTATLEFALQLQPEARQVVVVSGASGGDRYWVPELQNHLQNRHPKLIVTCLTNQTVAELSAQLHLLPVDTIVIYTTVFVDAAGKHYVPRDVAAQLSAVSSAPLYGLYETMLDHGIVGGVMPNLEAHGRQAGELGLRIVNGESPDAIPVQPALAGVPTVDWRQLQRWQISNNRLPSGNVIRFRPTTLWEDHKFLVLAGVGIILAQGTTIAILLWQRTRRRLAERAVGESETRMTLAANAAELNFWEWNLTSDEIWSKENGRMDFKQFLQSLHPDDREPLSHAVANSMNGSGDFKSEYRLLRSDGAVVWMAGRGRMEFDAAGRPVLMRGVSVDITHRKQAEMELQRQREELAHLSRVTMLGELSATLAHELSQPLGAILRNAEAAEIFLQHPSPDLEELRSIVTDIRKDDERAGAVINRMRAMLKRREVEHSRLNLNLLVAEAISLVRSTADARRVQLVFEPDPALSFLSGDRIQLQQVLLNLLLNAMDAVEGAAPESRQVILGLKQAGRQVEVTVRDRGHGIPADELPRLFEPFFTTKSNGLGLGLAISSTIVAAHGGQIRAENNSTGGATFSFRLPLNRIGKGA